MASTTTATTTPVFSPTRRFLPLWTYGARRQRTAKMHLAKVKTTKKATTEAWCGRTYFVGGPGPRTVTGEQAVLIAWADEHPTCALCLARVGAWDWEW